MYILNGSCGWLPEGPIKFIAKIVEIIRNLTPVILIIMGSIDFAKAIMSQDNNQIKKAQSSFIKRIIAGVAVFFVIVIIQWVAKIINNADSSTGASNAFSCLDALLNGNYKQDDKKYYEQPENTGTATSTTSTTKYKNLNYDTPDVTECIDTCIKNYTNGKYTPKYVNKGEIISNCEKSFKYNTGDFGIACSKLEDCVDSNKGCEEITEQESKNCKSEYNNYKKYSNLYGSDYTDNTNDIKRICEGYADTYLKQNIESICKNECDN